MTTQYSWCFQEDKTRDIGIFEITRSTTTTPYTVLIHNYSKTGPIQLFSDIFYAPSWDINRGEDGVVSEDVCFLIGLWDELGLLKEKGEAFHPKHITYEPDRYPTVYRKCITDVMAQLYGNGMVDITLANV